MWTSSGSVGLSDLAKLRPSLPYHSPTSRHRSWVNGDQLASGPYSAWIHDGETLEIDGLVSEVLPQGVKVVIRRMIPAGRLCRAADGAVLRRVRRDEVLEVIEGEERLWLNATALHGVNDERRGKVRKEVLPVMWTVGAEEIPAGSSHTG